ncbi:MAG: M23 family metallopeptidase [Lachnospiraceae bacterium]|nr:M23 family metallopeptidase [Lachnospiraceae bacterium]
MKKISRYNKKMRYIYIKCAVVASVLAILFFPTWTKFEKAGDNMFEVWLDETQVGVVAEREDADVFLARARKQLVKKENGIVFAECDMELKGQEVLFGKIDEEKDVVSKMAEVLAKNERQTLKQSFTVKINEYTVNVASTDEVLQLLQASINKYDSENKYHVSLMQDTTRELNVLTANVESLEEKKQEEKKEETPLFPEAGVYATLSEMFESVEPAGEKDFEDFELGLIDMEFGDEVEIVEAYLREDELTPLSEAIEQVTKDKEKNKIYEVVAGDTLGGIAYSNDLTIEKLIAMNDTIEDEFSTIRVGDELIVTVPEPELSIERKEENYYEEDYEAEVVYVDNDEWYTNQTKVLQEPSAGHRKVVAIVSYRNNAEVERELIKEEIVLEAVPKIVERGTKIPPTYIKPISGGRLSSRFGRRSAPTKGASTYHKGVDWATPIGTAVMASSTGTVARAGWGSGYGYVVYINHADGKQTRYAHLSKVLVSSGQKVSQGDKIALSGNTGVSSGPHVHFEILVNGKQVDPFEYLN